MLSMFWERGIFLVAWLEVSFHCVINMKDDISMPEVLKFPDFMEDIITNCWNVYCSEIE